MQLQVRVATETGWDDQQTQGRSGDAFEGFARKLLIRLSHPSLAGRELTAAPGEARTPGRDRRNTSAGQQTGLLERTILAFQQHAGGDHLNVASASAAERPFEQVQAPTRPEASRKQAALRLVAGSTAAGELVAEAGSIAGSAGPQLAKTPPDPAESTPRHVRQQADLAIVSQPAW